MDKETIYSPISNSDLENYDYKIKSKLYEDSFFDSESYLKSSPTSVESSDVSYGIPKQVKVKQYRLYKKEG